MNQIKTIFKNVSWVTLSQIVTNVFAFFWTILIARYLGVTQYGILSFVLSLVMIIGIGEDIGITTYTTRELARNRSLTQKFINNILPIKLILSLILLVLTIVSLHLLGYDLLTLELTFIIFFETIFLTNANFLSGVFQKIYNVFEFPEFDFDFDCWRTATLKSLPFGLTMFFYGIYFSIDVVMISWLANDYATGLYNAVYKIISVFSAFYLVYQYVIYPLMSKLYSKDPNLLKLSFNQSIKYSLLILLPIIIGMYFYSPYLIDLIYTNQYALASLAMQILIWAVIFLFINGVATSLLNSIGKEFSVTKIYIIAAIFNVALNYLLIPKYTYIGASVATVLSEILILGLMLHAISKTDYKPDVSLLKTVIKLVISGLILAIVLYYINVSLWLAIPIGLVVYVFALFITHSIDDTDKYIIKELLNR